LVDKAIEMCFQFARDFGRSPGARAINQTLGAVGGKAMHPFPQGRIGKLKRVGDVLDTPSFHDVTHGLGTAEDTGLLGLFQEGF
jgi:hypothetical protein